MKMTGTFPHSTASVCHNQLYYLDLMPALKDVMGAFKVFYMTARWRDNLTERKLHGAREDRETGIRFHLWGTYAIFMPAGLDFFYAACG